MRAAHENPPSNPPQAIPFAWYPDPMARAAALRAFQRRLEASQWLPPEKIDHWQRRRLSVLLAHASAHSPYYKRQLSNLPRDFAKDASVNLQDIPILTRDVLQGEYAEICTTAWPAFHGPAREIQTSGSTGQPVKVKRTGLCQMHWLALTLRDHLWHKRDFSASMAVVRVPAGPGGDKAAFMPMWGEAVNVVARSGPTHFLPISTDVNRQAEWLSQLNPGYLLTYPTNLAELLRIAEQGRLPLPGLREIRTIGETLSGSVRDECSRLLGVPVTDLYSSQELGIMALQCPVSSHYHVQSESVLLEILSDAGEPCRPGEVGRIVVTDLHNFATPLIRYELRDYAEAGPPCPCGRGLPTLRRILGRRRNMVVLPDGKRHWPLVGFQQFREAVPALKQYQLIQRTPKQIEARLVVAGNITSEQEGALTRVIQDALGYPFELRFDYRAKELHRTHGGKFEEFICQLDRFRGDGMHE
jgi:Coenzyme F390 synthetase